MEHILNEFWNDASLCLSKPERKDMEAKLADIKPTVVGVFKNWVEDRGDKFSFLPIEENRGAFTYVFESLISFSCPACQTEHGEKEKVHIIHAMTDIFQFYCPHSTNKYLPMMKTYPFFQMLRQVLSSSQKGKKFLQKLELQEQRGKEDYFNSAFGEVLKEKSMEEFRTHGYRVFYDAEQGMFAEWRRKYKGKRYESIQEMLDDLNYSWRPFVYAIMEGIPKLVFSTPDKQSKFFEGNLDTMLKKQNDGDVVEYRFCGVNATKTGMVNEYRQFNLWSLPYFDECIQYNAENFHPYFFEQDNTCLKKGIINTFGGFQAKYLEEYDQSKVDVLLNYMEEHLCNNDKQSYEFALDWLSGKCQKPFIKREVINMFIGKKGTLKSKFFGFVSDKIFGEWNCYTISGNGSKSLIDKANGFLENKLLLILDDMMVPKAQQKEIDQALKGYTTGGKTLGKRNYHDAGMMKTPMEIVILDNHEDTYMIKDDSRRYLAIETNSELSVWFNKNQKKFDAYADKLNDNMTQEHANHFFTYLINRKCSHPADKPMKPLRNEMFKRIVQSSQNSVEIFLTLATTQFDEIFFDGRDEEMMSLWDLLKKKTGNEEYEFRNGEMICMKKFFYKKYEEWCKSNGHVKWSSTNMMKYIADTGENFRVKITSRKIQGKSSERIVFTPIMEEPEIISVQEYEAKIKKLEDKLEKLKKEKEKKEKEEEKLVEN